jgi:hypothetical protein
LLLIVTLMLSIWLSLVAVAAALTLLVAVELAGIKQPAISAFPPALAIL